MISFGKCIFEFSFASNEDMHLAWEMRTMNLLNRDCFVYLLCIWNAKMTSDRTCYDGFW